MNQSNRQSFRITNLIKVNLISKHSTHPRQKLHKLIRIISNCMRPIQVVSKKDVFVPSCVCELVSERSFQHKNRFYYISKTHRVSCFICLCPLFDLFINIHTCLIPIINMTFKCMWIEANKIGKISIWFIQRKIKRHGRNT